LPQETRNYVPRLLALAQVLKDPKEHGVRLRHLADIPYFRAVEIHRPMEMQQVANIAQVNTATLKKLNPGLRQGVIGVGGQHRLLLPTAQATQFKARLAQVNPQQSTAPSRYLVRRGDTLTSIASRFSVSESALRSANNIRHRHLRSGQALLIPTAEPVVAVNTAPTIAGLAAPSSTLPDAPRKVATTPIHHVIPGAIPRINHGAATYVVKPQESLAAIARAHNLDPKQLAAWNGLPFTAVLRAGQVLRLQSWADITVRKVVVYQVQQGDSLAQIAQRFGVSVADLHRWNSFGKDGFKPGLRLTLRVTAPLKSSL
jgi:membrane-bound lytic murein transglycosylase D